MKETRLWQIISQLETEDRLRLDKWLASPYHNLREDLRILWSNLRNVGEPPGKELAWQQMYPERDFDAAAFNRSCSRLTRQLEDYLADQIRQSEGAARQYLDLAQAYRQRDAPDLFQKALRRSEQALARSSFRNDEFFLHQFQVQHLRYNTQSLVRQRTTGGLEEMSDALDAWFVLQKLRQACSHIALRRVGAPLAPLSFLEEVLQKVREGHFADFPAIRIYFAAYQMLSQTDGQADFDRLIAELESHARIFPPDELRSTYLMAINFCVQQINRGVPGALAAVYALYQKGLASKWIFEQGKLSPWTFKNIVSAGLKLKDFNGVESFLQDYADHLPEDVRQTHHRYNRAELEFARGDYRTALQSLSATVFRDPLTELRARILQIKAAFETRQVDLVEYQLDNLRKFISRKQNLSYHRDHYRNFGRFTRQLLARKPGAEHTTLMMQRIQEQEQVVEKKWLLEKAKEPWF